ALAPAPIVSALLLTAIAMAASSTICGALLVENGQRYGASSAFINQQWLWFNVAVMAATLLGGQLIEHLSSEGALHAAAEIAAQGRSRSCSAALRWSMSSDRGQVLPNSSRLCADF